MTTAYTDFPGLQSMVPFWKEALEMVLDVEPGQFVSLLVHHHPFLSLAPL